MKPHDAPPTSSPLTAREPSANGGLDPDPPDPGARTKPLDVVAIRARYELEIAQDDVPALCDEVERLQGRIYALRIAIAAISMGHHPDLPGLAQDALDADNGAS